MSESDVEQICRAVLYEGYLLYPYRPSRKDRLRWNFGCVFPRASGLRESGRDGWRLGAQCLVRGDPTARLTGRLRFLRLATVRRPGPSGEAWEEAGEQVITACARLDELTEASRRPFHLPRSRRADGPLLRECASLDGALIMQAEPLGDRLWKISLEIENETPTEATEREALLPQTMLSAHVLLALESGAFVSLIDPPEDCASAVKTCRAGGLWPVLVGRAGSHDSMLCAPIILYDYPQIAPQSPGDYFDGTEIDEMLALRVLTLSDEERQAIASRDPRGGNLLRRTEQLTRQALSSLHGTMRPNPAGPPGLDSVRVAGAQVRPGDKVRLRPQRQADPFDIMLAGEVATVESIQQDLEDRIHVAVTIDADPGRELGQAQQIGHRFFFAIDEIEPLAPRGANGV